ncbi:MAG: FtsQ-type POTRA domain-containing protein [Bifidobacteriaceae bacterium]|jgi:cell division protein FtsQ|nr:FtsQ-type POTRA domain-containing protein [Bifidobacteriaceae bacterium]
MSDRKVSKKRHEGPIYKKPENRKIVSSVHNTGEIKVNSKKKPSAKKVAKLIKRQFKKGNIKKTNLNAKIIENTDEKKKLNKKKFHGIMTVFLTVLTILVLLWIIFLSPVFALNSKNIRIEGTSKYISEKQILSDLKGYIGTPITVLNISDIEGQLYKLNGVSGAEIERLWTNGLTIRITPSAPLAYEKNDKKFRIIEKTGKTVQILDKKPSDFPEIVVKSKENKLAEPFILQALSSVSADFRKKIISMQATTFDNIKSVLNSGETVIWGSNENISKKETIIKKILSNGQLLAGRKTIDISATYKPIIK